MITIVTLLLAFIQLGVAASFGRASFGLQQTTQDIHVIEPGDTWSALGQRYQVEQTALQAATGMMNQQLEPAIGSIISLPAGTAEQTGRLVRTDHGGLLQTAVLHAVSPWQIALGSDTSSPYLPAFYRPLAIPADDALPKDYPVGMQMLEVLRPVAQPGEALVIRAVLLPEVVGADGSSPVAATLNKRTISIFSAGERVTGIGATGAFFGSNRPEMRIQVADGPVWAQPWLFQDRTWGVENLYLSGSAAQIDQDAIAAERQRLEAIWLQASPVALWKEPFQLPISEKFPMSGEYGSRRSYNGGPYETYHEGVDYSAFGGTPVVAPAAGTVVLAENLYVRGGSVIIDHGLGVYSGYYHLSSITAAAGQTVAPGDELGTVGTTGLSTGNHLHWDLLVNGVNVDAIRWMEYGSECWILEGLGQPCETPGS